MTDLELITRVKDKQDSAAISQLVELHTGLYVNMVKRYASYPDFTKKIDVKDLLDDKAFNIYQFALKYDPSRGMKFGTYVAESTKYMCQGILHRGSESIQFNEETAPNNDTSVTDIADRDSRSEELLREIRESESPLFRQIVKLKMEGLSWRQIAKEVKMSHEGARKVYEKNIGAVREHLKS